MNKPVNITALLKSWQSGDEHALAALTDSLYAELHRIASNAFRGESSGHTLQPTALVNEAFVKLIDAKVDWQDRAHFLALSARMMRRILVNYATARDAKKRGGPERALTLVEDLMGSSSPDPGIEK